MARSRSARPAAQRRLVGLEQQVDLLLHRDVEGVGLDGRAPAAVAHHLGGASSTGRLRVAAFALACDTACRATRSTSSGASSRLAANPQAPFASTRTPKPKVSASWKPVMRRSRVATDCVRLR